MSYLKLKFDFCLFAFLKSFQKCSEHVATRCPTGKLPLHYAAINGQLDIVALLFEFPYPDHVLMEMSHNFGSIKQHFHHAFDPNTLDFDSKSALYYACENGHYNLVKYMLHRQVMACRTCEPLPQIQINSRKVGTDAIFVLF